MSKKQIVKFEQPKTSSRVEQLRFQAMLRGEIEEEKQKLNVKRFLIISAIIIAILVGGLIFTSSKIDEINRHNEQAAAQQLAQQTAAAETVTAPEEAVDILQEELPESQTDAEGDAAPEEVPADAETESAPAAEEQAEETAEERAGEAAAEATVNEPAAAAANETADAGNQAARPFEIVRIIFLFLFIACAVCFYTIMARRKNGNRDKKQVTLMCALLAILLVGFIVFGIIADQKSSAAANGTAAVETESAADAGETVERAADTSNQIDTSIATWNLVHFALIVLLIAYGFFMLVKLARPKRRKPNRSFWGDLGIYIIMFIFAVAMVFPLVFSVASSLKPLDELFRFPPRVFPSHVTLDNFSDLIVTMGQSWVPFSRYLINTVFITFVGTLGHVIIASMAAFVLAKYDFPGGRTFFKIVVTALMFSGYVTGIPNYITMSRLHMIDTYWAIILPAFAAPIGLFLMKQFMESLPNALIEAAHLDGAGEFRIFLNIIMPNVKPAWLTIIIFSVQSLWNTNAATVIYTENKKTLVYALGQIQAGGIARTGQAAAVTVIVMIVPILIFILSQSRILETMASSGLKD